MMEKIVKETFIPDTDEKKPKKKAKREVKKVDKVIEEKSEDIIKEKKRLLINMDHSRDRGAIHFPKIEEIQKK